MQLTLPMDWDRLVDGRQCYLHQTEQGKHNPSIAWSDMEDGLNHLCQLLPLLLLLQFELVSQSAMTYLEEPQTAYNQVMPDAFWCNGMVVVVSVG